MADGYGGAKPKTRGNNSRKTYSTRDVDDLFDDLTETSFSNSQINSQVYKRENTNLNKIPPPAHKGAKPKLTKSVNTDVKSVKSDGDGRARRSDVYNGTPVLNGIARSETRENKRLQEIGKISKEKEQEYLSARERWKKSGLALRKYIAEKLGFKQDKSKPGDSDDMPLSRDRKRSSNTSADKKWKAKQEKLLTCTMDKISIGSDSSERQENGIIKSKSEDLLKDRNNLERSRSEGSKDDVLPRSRSLLRYLGLKKEKSSPKAGQNGLKISKSFEMSSSDAWPESSTDTSKSAASDWSADNTLTNYKAGNNIWTNQNCSDWSADNTLTNNSIWTNQKCQSTQTHLPTSHKCDKGTKTENTNEHRHKNRTHRNTKLSKTSKDSKKKQKDKSEKNVSKTDRGKQKKEVPAQKWVGILDDAIHTSSDEFEFVLDPEYGEVVRRVKEGRPSYLSEQQNPKSPDNGVGEETSQIISDSTVEAMLGLHHALPYLPERFRNRLQAVQNPSDDQSQTTPDASNTHDPGETTTRNKMLQGQRERTVNSLLSDSVVRNKREQKPDKKKSKKNRDNWKKRNSEDDDRICDSGDYMFDTIEDYERNLEVSLEDPFNVRTNSNIDLCSGLMDLVKEIDIPFIDEDGETRFNNSDKGTCTSCSQREINTGYDSVTDDSRTLLNSSNDFVNFGMDSNLDSLNETSFEDDPDYPGMKTLNDSFNRLLGDNDTDTSTDSSIMNDFLQRSRSDESGSRTKSSDDSLEADDEFECECDHCQLLRQHSYGTNNLDLLPPRLYSEDTGFSYNLPTLDIPTESAAAGHSDTESNQGFRSSMFLDEYDFLMDRSSNELDWLIIDSRPLSVMLEDVIQQMLAVQPELLNEQAAPPAPQTVIENLPTITLTSSHIVQHPSCPICLCPCEMDEIMSLLPCQHIFHPICIQAWLVKSGTCPVCRGRISR